MKKTKLITTTLLISYLLISCSPDNIEKGNVCLSLGDYPMAIEFFNKEVRKHPKNYEARLGLGKSYLQKAVDNDQDTTSWKKALIHLEAVRTLNPNTETVKLISQVWAEYSQKLLSGGDTVSALEALSSALQYDPGSVEIINSTGILYFRLGYAEKAEVLFKKAVALDSTNVHSFFNLGMLFWSANDVENARTYWLKALSMSPEDEDILYWFARAEKVLRGQK